MTTARVRTMLAAAAVAMLLFPYDAHAQLKGHYVPGFTGVQNGTQGSPAVTLVLPTYFYTTDALKNDQGETIGQDLRINSTFLGPGVLWVTNIKVLGAHLGGQVLPAAIMKARIEAASLNVPGAFDFSDIYVQPVQLGWEHERADFVAGWGVFVPTGKWELGGDDNSGLGMWSNLVQAGTTVRLDDHREWTASLLGTYELHSKKNNVEIQVGDILTLEGGLGRSFYKAVADSAIPRVATIGLAYYTQVKVTSDFAGILTPLIAGRKDHVFGVGVEGSLFLPKPKLLVGLRVVPEFGAVNRTQGFTFMLTLAHQTNLLTKKP